MRCLASEGLSGAAIATPLNLSEGTVRNSLSERMSKLGTHNRVEATRIARAKGVAPDQHPSHILTINRSGDSVLLMAKTSPKADILQGTLDLMVLTTLDALGPLHGFGIAQRIQQVSEDTLYLNQGTLYPALLRLAQKGWITSAWGVSDNNRRARFYSLTKSGRKQLKTEAADWARASALVNRLLTGHG